MSNNENRERAQRLKLPTAVISRIVKNALPDSAKISLEAKCVVSRAASVFVLNMATFATDHAQGKKRKMVQAEDVMAALKGLECERLEQKIAHMIEAWKQKRAEKNADAAKKRADRRAAAAAVDSNTSTSATAQATPQDESLLTESPSKDQEADTTLDDTTHATHDQAEEMDQSVVSNLDLPETVPL